MRLSDIIRRIERIFEKKRKNPIQIEDDSNLESKLKNVKVADTNTPIQISTDTVDIKGSLKVNGVDVSTEPDDTGSGATELNELSDVTYSSGDLTISSLDTIVSGDLTLDSTGDIALSADGGNITMDDGTTTIFDFDVDNVVLKSDAPLKIKEAASAAADTTAYGQLWVKSDSPNNLYFTDDTGQDVQLTNDGASTGASGIQSAVVTISDTEMNGLHSITKTLIAAQGISQVIIPINIALFVDRDASTAQTNSVNLCIGYNGGTTTGTDVWFFLKRFMYNESGDRIFNIEAMEQFEVAQTYSAFENVPLTARMSGAITSGSIDSVRVVIQYYVYDNSL